MSDAGYVVAMLPSAVFGSVTTSKGTEPFVLMVSNGDVRLGRYAPAPNRQAALPKDVVANIERQVLSQVAGATAVRVGWYRCHGCGTWVNVAGHPQRWGKDSCRRCAG